MHIFSTIKIRGENRDAGTVSLLAARAGSNVKSAKRERGEIGDTGVRTLGPSGMEHGSSQEKVVRSGD